MLDRLSLQIFRFASFYLLVRGLSKAEFGTWTMFLVLCSFFEVIRQGFIQHALVRALSLHEEMEDRRKINSASLFLNFLLGILISIALYGLSLLQPYIWSFDMLSELFLIYIITSFCLIPFFHFQFVQQANLTFHGIFFSTLLRHAFFFGYVLYVYFSPDMEYDLIKLAWVQALAAGIGGITSIVFAWPFLHFSRQINLYWVKKLINFGKYVTGTNLGMILFKFLDQIILGMMISPVVAAKKAVAGYSTAVRIGNLVEVPTQSIAAIVFPQSARQHEDQGEDAVKDLYEKSTGVIMAMVIPGVLLVCLFPEQCLRFVAGDRYLDMAHVLQVVMLSSLLVPFSRQFSTIMDAIGKPKLNFKLKMAGAAINALLLILLIPLMQEMGAAIGTLLSYIFLVVAALIILHRELKVNPFQPIKFAFRLYFRGFRMIFKPLRGRAD